MSILDYIRPNIFNNPVANSIGMYNPNKKIGNKGIDNLSALQQYKGSQQQPNSNPFQYKSLGSTQSDFTQNPLLNSEMTHTNPNIAVDPLLRIKQFKLRNQEKENAFKYSESVDYQKQLQDSLPVDPVQQFVTQPTPAVASNELTPIDIKPNTINQFLYPGIQQSPMTQNMSPTKVEQPKTNILGEQIPMDQLPKDVGYVNGKLFDSNKQSTQGMFNGYSKERDASLNSYGKVDKNSEFYKRNKKAMENLQ